MTTTHYIPLPHQITCIDTGLNRPGMVACYLVEQRGAAAFIDTGTGNSVPRLLELLRRRGLAESDVHYVMPTHVHLDHAGGAGSLLRALPNARLVVHPRGVRHLVDPGRLMDGSRVVYGAERFQRLFGTVDPVDPERVLEAPDGFTVDLNGRRLTCLDTPGHARHHYCVFDESSRGLFSGDTFGASYRELNQGQRPFVFASTTPVQFDPRAWLDTLRRLQELEPQRVFLAHFGMRQDVQLVARLLARSIEDYAEIALDCRGQEQPAQAIEAMLMEHGVNHALDAGCGLTPDRIRAILQADMELNALGLAHWLESGAG